MIDVVNRDSTDMINASAINFVDKIIIPIGYLSATMFLFPKHVDLILDNETPIHGPPQSINERCH